jgi:hypothetical protein
MALYPQGEANGSDSAQLTFCRKKSVGGGGRQGSAVRLYSISRDRFKGIGVPLRPRI